VTDEYTPEWRDEVLGWMELPTKAQVFAAVAAHDAEIRRDQAEKDAAIAGNSQSAGLLTDPVPGDWAADARARLIRRRILSQFPTPSPETGQEPRTHDEPSERIWASDMHMHDAWRERPSLSRRRRARSSPGRTRYARHPLH